MAAVLGVSAPLSPLLGRVIGLKFTVAAGLAAVAGGLWQVSAVSAVTTTYQDVVPGLLLVGLGVGLLLPTATNSVVGSVPQATPDGISLQRRGAAGRRRVRGRRDRERAVDSLPGSHDRGAGRRHLPPTAVQTILGSLGGARAVAARAGAPRRPARLCCPRSVHERQRDSTGRRRCRRPRRCCPRTRAPAASGFTGLTDPQPRTVSTGPSPNAHATAATEKDAGSREKPDAAIHVRADRGRRPHAGEPAVGDLAGVPRIPESVATRAPLAGSDPFVTSAGMSSAPAAASTGAHG